MSESEVRNGPEGSSFPSLLRQRLLRWNESDRKTFIDLVSRLKIGQNHQRDLMDWLEEIAIRDAAQIRDILSAHPLAKIESDPRLGRADKLKRMKEHLRRLRFPRLTESEDAVRSRIRDLKLEPQVRVSVPPGLEGGRLHFEFSVATATEFEDCVRKLADARECDSLNQAFAMLAGKVCDQGSENGGPGDPD